MQLIDGCIPPNTECPLRARCMIAEGGACMHTGILHEVAFACSGITAIALIDAVNEQEGRKKEDVSSG